MKSKYVIVFVAIVATLLNACASKGDAMFFRMFNTNNDRRGQMVKIDNILDALQRRDEEDIKTMFSVNAVERIDDFDKTIKELFEYFQGHVVSYEDPCGGPEEQTEINDGHKKEERYWTYDVKTSVNQYRIAFYEVSCDTENTYNVGIWSLYIIELEKDTDPQFAYRGDGMYTTGIHIGVRNVLP